MSKAGQIKRQQIRSSEAGYTYISVLVMVVGVALAAQSTWIPASTTSKRASEDELIFRGTAYAQAIESYWRADPENPSFPSTLEDLLIDPRDGVTRHIRRLYEPVFSRDWTIVQAEEGGIKGVSPGARIQPLKTANFPAEMIANTESQVYSDWIFAFEPTQPK